MTYFKAMLVALMTCVLLTGCHPEKEQAKITVNLQNDTRCINGVTYLLIRERGNNRRGYGYATVMFNRDSKVIPCTSITNR